MVDIFKKTFLVAMIFRLTLLVYKLAVQHILYTIDRVVQMVIGIVFSDVGPFVARQINYIVQISSYYRHIFYLDPFVLTLIGLHITAIYFLISWLGKPHKILPLIFALVASTKLSGYSTYLFALHSESLIDLFWIKKDYFADGGVFFFVLWTLPIIVYCFLALLTVTMIIVVQTVIAAARLVTKQIRALITLKTYDEQLTKRIDASLKYFSYYSNITSSAKFGHL